MEPQGSEDGFEIVTHPVAEAPQAEPETTPTAEEQLALVVRELKKTERTQIGLASQAIVQFYGGEAQLFREAAATLGNQELSRGYVDGNGKAIFGHGILHALVDMVALEVSREDARAAQERTGTVAAQEGDVNSPETTPTQPIVLEPRSLVEALAKLKETTTTEVQTDTPPPLLDLPYFGPIDSRIKLLQFTAGVATAGALVGAGLLKLCQGTPDKSGDS